MLELLDFISCWAVYLNENQEKIVIAPKNWNDPRRVHDWEWRYMDNWIRMQDIFNL